MTVLAPRAVNIERVVKVLATFFGEDSATLLVMARETNKPLVLRCCPRRWHDLVHSSWRFSKECPGRHDRLMDGR